MAPEASLEAPIPAPLPLGEWFIRQALGLNQVRVRRLTRLGLLPSRVVDVGSLREAYDQVLELERRVAAIGGRLTDAERHGSLAWLIEAARLPSGSAPAAVRDRVAELLSCIEAQRPSAEAPLRRYGEAE